MAHLILLSIAVCTYNRAGYLASCLESLSETEGDERVEILVIDNNSIDCTSDIVLSYQVKHPHTRYIFEPQQGLSIARNRALREAEGKYVAFIDDDAKAKAGWASAIIRCFEAHPDAGAVGGPHDAFCRVPVPEWFPMDYGTWTLGNRPMPLGSKQWLIGLNVAFRKDLAVRLGGFNTAIGMNGDTLSYGEETNLQHRMKGLGIPIWYDPEIAVTHAIQPYKLSLRWLLQSSYASGLVGAATFNYQGGRFRYLLKLGLILGRSLFVFLGCPDRHIKTRLYRSVGPLLWHYGFFKGLIR